jgi:hypothetical protein
MTTPDYRLPDSPLVFPEGLFCVKTSLGPRQGYFLVRWLEGPMENNSRVHIIIQLILQEVKLDLTPLNIPYIQEKVMDVL